ncbi:N-acetylmuramoyl-L-alanine amidase [Sphingobacterium paludis]|uniref:N-acetylmuramoyl-L-alanine amidase n=1 Tax=Sphingobacterium paludis TaxID=1476465 RepID=A0A4R7D4Y8_9SPHI|nr:N-acetylmuramoyl-L-alanine amidase [Sphingobacterium paludis]TDS14734.1 N-acetylmuramoyl-L-alanine amidase [Sphingobacterium paludis]
MRKIYLIAGHHNADPGAIGNGFRENALNIELRGLIHAAIKRHDKSVVVILDDDRDTLAQVIAKVKQTVTTNDILLDIHFNSFIQPKASGAEVLVANNARGLSLDIAKELSALTALTLQIPNRGVKTESQSARGKLGILHTAASSALLEVGFISNPTDMANYQQWKEKLADGIAKILVKRAQS